jgi:circadian clock protein KaiC
MTEPAIPAARPKVSIGIPGLDTILAGGLESERVYVVEGTPGTGKTTLGLSFLLEGVRHGETTLYITLSESEAELRAVAESHGWSLDGIDVFELVTEAGLDAEAEQTVLHPSELELGETARAVMARVQALNPARIVFDSLSEIRLLAQNAQRYRRQVLALKHFFTQMRCTVLLLDDRTSEPSTQSGDLQLHSLAHGVVILEQVPLDFGAERRRLRVVKLRGSRFRGGFHDFTIEAGGLAVYPRLIAHEHHTDFNHAPVSSGVAELDLLLGGGLYPGTNTLLIGPSGAGKTTTAICAMFAGLRRGEHAAFFLFDEGLPTLLARSAALGMDLRPFIASGHLSIRQVDPAEMSPGEFTHHVRIAVEHHHAKLVVIDSLNAYMQSMPGAKYLVLQLHELLTYLNQRGVITLMVLAQHGMVGHMASQVDLSYLADSIVLLRYFEVDGEVRKAISVVKTRTANHERTIREFTIGSAGVTIGASLKGFRGVLGGSPVWDGPPAPLAYSASVLA